MRRFKWTPTEDGTGISEYSLQLQGIGWTMGLPGWALRPGDVMVWNGGGTETVTGIIGETAAFVTVSTEYVANPFYNPHPVQSTRKIGKNRIVGVAGVVSVVDGGAA